MIIFYDDIISLKYRLARKIDTQWSYSKSALVRYVDSIEELSDFTDTSEDIFGETSEENTVIEVSALHIDEIARLQRATHIIYCCSLLESSKPTKKVRDSFAQNGLDCVVLEGFEQSQARNIAEIYIKEQSYNINNQDLSKCIQIGSSYQQLLHILDTYVLSDCNTEVLQWFSTKPVAELYKTSFPQDVTQWINSDPNHYQMNLALASTKSKKHSNSKQLQQILINTDESMKSDPHQEAWWSYAMWQIKKVT